MPAPPPTAYSAGTRLTVGSHDVEIEKFIGEGGFAHVYTVRATPPIPGHEVCCLKRVQVPNKAYLNLLRAEVDAMQRLIGASNVVQYFDSHAERMRGAAGAEGQYEVFLLMEFCSGGGLIDFMNTRLRDQLREHEILKIMYDITLGLAHMHYLMPPLLHRDLKIENVLIAGDGTFKLCDFGSVSPVLRPPKTPQELQILEDDINHQTTVQYRAPEMVSMAQGLPINEKSDIWALGVFLYKLCYYTTPFERPNQTLEQFQQLILSGAFVIPPRPAYSERLRNMIRVLLQLDPRMRPNVFQVMQEICQMRHVECPIKDIYSVQQQRVPVPVVSGAGPLVIGDPTTVTPPSVQAKVPVQAQAQAQAQVPTVKAEPPSSAQLQPQSLPKSQSQSLKSQPVQPLQQQPVQPLQQAPKPGQDTALASLETRFPSLEELDRQVPSRAPSTTAPIHDILTGLNDKSSTVIMDTPEENLSSIDFLRTLRPGQHRPARYYESDEDSDASPKPYRSPTKSLSHSPSHSPSPSQSPLNSHSQSPSNSPPTSPSVHYRGSGEYSRVDWSPQESRKTVHMYQHHHHPHIHHLSVSSTVPNPANIVKPLLRHRSKRESERPAKPAKSAKPPPTTPTQPKPVVRTSTKPQLKEVPKEPKPLLKQQTSPVPQARPKSMIEPELEFLPRNSIQQRVHTFLKSHEQQHPVVRTARGYGKYTDGELKERSHSSRDIGN